MSERTRNDSTRPLLKKGASNLLLFLIVLIELFTVLVPYEDVSRLVTFLQLEIALITLSAFLYVNRAALLALSIYFIWILVTDNIGVVFSQEWAAMEVLTLGAILYWVYRRPERIPSDPVKDTICLAFYYGDKSPFLAQIASLLSLPYTGIAVIIGDKAMVPSSTIQCRPSKVLRKWLIIDTYIKPDGLMDAFNDLEGKEVKYAGCMAAFKPFLELLGFRLGVDPAEYLLQVLENR